MATRLKNYISIKIYFSIVLSVVVTTASAADGEALYNHHCSVCHGENGSGGTGVPLSLPSFIDSVSNEYLTKTIRMGRPGRVMPAFTMLDDDQVESIVEYIRSWSHSPNVKKYDSDVVRGDEKHGKKLFAQHCAQCHGEDGKGGKGTGVTFSRKRDLPIIAPALNNPGFLASATDAMIKETLLAGRKGTPMLPSKDIGLNEKNVDDLVSYIRSFQVSSQSLNNIIEDPVIVRDSPYSLEETVENIKQAISNQNFVLIRIENFEHGFVDESEENKRQVIFHFCNFDFLYQALAIDPRVGLFLPCRITAVEQDNRVKLFTINPKRLSRLFNNSELDKACDKMQKLYIDIMEDAIL